jgi:hypothetical protein
LALVIENRIHHNLYMDFGVYPINIGQELTSGDDIWCSGNISEFLIMAVVGSGGEVLWCVTLIPKVKKMFLHVLIHK